MASPRVAKNAKITTGSADGVSPPLNRNVVHLAYFPHFLVNLPQAADGAGHEQVGRRPALIVHDDTTNNVLSVVKQRVTKKVGHLEDESKVNQVIKELLGL